MLFSPILNQLVSFVCLFSFSPLNQLVVVRQSGKASPNTFLPPEAHTDIIETLFRNFAQAFYPVFQSIHHPTTVPPVNGWALLHAVSEGFERYGAWDGGVGMGRWRGAGSAAQVPAGGRVHRVRPHSVAQQCHREELDAGREVSAKKGKIQ